VIFNEVLLLRNNTTAISAVDPISVEEVMFGDRENTNENVNPPSVVCSGLTVPFVQVGTNDVAKPVTG
jgi:hypothetical protein